MTKVAFSDRVRPPAVAGRFYPGEARELRALVEGLLRASGESPEGRVRVVVAPHAGYPYSGPTAAHGYAKIGAQPVRRAFLLGRSHRFGFEGVSFPAAAAFETPLGRVLIDQEEVRLLAATLGATTPEAHELEHTLEVQLPFIQVALGGTVIVPMLFGSDPEPWHIQAGAYLAAQMGEDDLLVVSTDLSHYLREAEANVLDEASLQLVLGQSPEAVCASSAAGTCSMCGGSAVAAGMSAALALDAREWRLLDYRTSGAASGDFERVVGYGALSMAHAA